ncbi:DNA (cytosine-5-)-methyltransferase [Sphingomonas sp. PB2P19]|uniref:DNA cytosine methyltransferase n=1 Tax=Sphingomonas rhamnosi TaxID=3096156 RepID=UPI002FC75660
MATRLSDKPYASSGTEAPWYKGRDIDDRERARFRDISLASKEAKKRAVSGECLQPKYEIPTPNLSPSSLMPQLPENKIRALSLFSGGGGLDIGFERAGYRHVASYELLSFAGDLLKAARPDWNIFSGDDGDVTKVDWSKYKGRVDVLHGGPPCQPFSHAGNRQGAADARDMIPEFVRAVLDVEPKAFLCENVSGLATKKFEPYLKEYFFDPLSPKYSIFMFKLEASDFGVPQRRRRVFMVGFKTKAAARRFEPPRPTHQWELDTGVLSNLPFTMGARSALGLGDIGVDALAPTLRSGLTGPRHTTSVVNSATAAKQWAQLAIWPNGVAPTREAASAFIAKDNHFRLSILDCMVLQGFPADWPIEPPVYKALGLIGNSVAPPMGYAVAAAIAAAL